MMAEATSSSLFSEFIQDPRHLRTSGNWQMHIFDTQQHSLKHICTARSMKSVPHIKASPRDVFQIHNRFTVMFDWKRLYFLMSWFLSFLSNILNLYHGNSRTIYLLNRESDCIKEKHFYCQHQWWLKEKHQAALPGESHLPSAPITIAIC